jgi:DNA-binding GntR family transcriptional regulator
MLFARVQSIRFLALGFQVRWDQSIDEHREVLVALEARDPSGAGAALARHIRHTGQLATSLLQAVTNDPSPSRSQGTT